MPIDSSTLSSLASEYAKGMTSIRGRRVQRLIKREFSGAEHVLIARTGTGSPLVLGLSPSGAAFCATDGRGRQASLIKWSHGAAMAVEIHFDLLKDSLPALGSGSLALAQLREQIQLRVAAERVPPQAGEWVSLALQALA